MNFRSDTFHGTDSPFNPFVIRKHFAAHRAFAEYITVFQGLGTREEREKVELFVSDMWKPYQETAKWYFPNATKVVDKYHWKRQIAYPLFSYHSLELKPQHLTKNLIINIPGT